MIYTTPSTTALVPPEPHPLHIHIGAGTTEDKLPTHTLKDLEQSKWSLEDHAGSTQDGWDLWVGVIRNGDSLLRRME